MNPTDVLPDSGQIPKSLRYSEITPKGLKASANFVDFLPNNGSSFGENQTIRIPIQSFGQFLDTQHSYLNFKVTVDGTAGDSIIFDGGASSIFKRVRVLSSMGNELERIDDYPALAALLSDITRSYGNYISQGGLCEGLYADGSTVTRQRNVAIPNPAVAQSTTFSLPLHCSGILGMLLRKYLPLPIINNGVILELTVSPVNYCTRAANPVTAFTVSELKYVAALVTPPTDFVEMFRQITSRSGLVLSSVSFRNYVSQIAGTTGTNTIKIIDSLKSVKSLLGMLRRTTNLTATTGYSVTSRGREGLQTYQIRLNNTPIPYSPIDVRGALSALNVSTGGSSPSQGYIELLKAMSRLGDSQIGFNITGEVYSADDTTQLITSGQLSQSPKFAFGLDLEAFQGQAILSGSSMYSGNSSEIQVVLVGAGNNACQVDVFLMYDMEVVIDPMGNVTVNY